jgi:hypothetical protein
MHSLVAQIEQMAPLECFTYAFNIVLGHSAAWGLFLFLFVSGSRPNASEICKSMLLGSGTPD